MAVNAGWTRQQLLVAFSLYCQMPFGKMHSRNPEIIKYAKLIGRTQSALAMKLTNIASLDPVITSSGRKGLDGASAADRAMWDEMQRNWEDFALESRAVLSSFGADNEADSGIDASALESASYEGKNKTAMVAIRMGQGFFRRSVLSAYDNQCCITGLAMPELLVASHIVPWRDDEKNRLNPMNGLCLSVMHDKAFDIGIITISEDMTVKVSRKYLESKNHFFGTALIAYDGKTIAAPKKFHPREEFLAIHRRRFSEAQCG
ncbi:MAG: HNH endonuclease [Steroidobacteraceae bacterium]